MAPSMNFDDLLIYHHGNLMGIWWEYDGNMMGIWWEYGDWSQKSCDYSGLMGYDWGISWYNGFVSWGYKEFMGNSWGTEFTEPKRGHHKNIKGIEWQYHGFTGWWFGTWLLFFHVLGIIFPTDEHIFQRAWQTTNQWCLYLFDEGQWLA